jgi:hypothetical protein
MIAFDNLSHLQDWFSDDLCRLATGGGFAVRTRYETAEETIFEAQRPLILNGIEELATRADRLDRGARAHPAPDPRAARREGATG